MIELYAQTLLPTRFGNFKVSVFRDPQQVEHLAIQKGDIGTGEGVLVRIHSECFTSEVMGSLKCDCREQLEMALKKIEETGKGVVIYLRQEGRGIGLGNKIRAYALQEKGIDTVDANTELGFAVDSRNYDIAVEILQYLGVKTIHLMTNNPDKYKTLQAHLPVLSRIPMVIASNPHSEGYLETKRTRLGHLNI